MMKRYIGVTLNQTGRPSETLQSNTRRGLHAMAKRRGTVIVDSWPSNDPPPVRSDAREWDAYRNRHGYAGG
jgi:hypothetical protein